MTRAGVYEFREPEISYRVNFTLLRRKPRLRAESHSGAQAWVFRSWMNAKRVPLEAGRSVVGLLRRVPPSEAPGRGTCQGDGVKAKLYTL
jgi:hypothetical protein